MEKTVLEKIKAIMVDCKKVRADVLLSTSDLRNMSDGFIKELAADKASTLIANTIAPDIAVRHSFKKASSKMTPDCMATQYTFEGVFVHPDKWRELNELVYTIERMIEMKDKQKFSTPI